MPTGFWVKGYWEERSAEPIKTIQIKLSAEPIKIERNAESIKIIQHHETTDASTQAPLALVPVTCPHRASCNLYIVNVGPAQLIHMSFCTAFFAGTVKCCGDRPHHQEGGGSRRDADQQGMYIRGAAMRSLEPNHVCLVLALSHIKSPQPKVSEYAWALCYPPSP